jgi:UDPglucose--hexose-1-phosphate uridylyltransferase
VVIAPGRATRPGAIGRTSRISDARQCPFCDGHEQLTPPETLALGRDHAGRDTPGWTVRVVPNKFPALSGQEVVVHGPLHAATITEVATAVVDEVARAWRMRADAHTAAGSAWVTVCVNEGAGAGASLEHSHSQVLPFAALPPLVETRVEATSPPCRLCEALPHESGRTIAVANGVRTFCPGWSRVPYETWLVPERHEAQPGDPRVIARGLVTAVRGLRGLLGTDLPWNAIVHSSWADDLFHWHVEILPRLTVPASLELGAGLWVNVVDPDSAADELRRAAES